MSVLLGLAFACVFSAPATPAATADLAVQFRAPPAAAKPWVYWYWMQASVSREGITADLEAMASAGIGGAYLMPIKGPPEPPHMDPPVNQLTPEWWAMVRHAMDESDRLGLDLALHVSDGFATAGGPWITPELSMQRVVWTETHVAGGRALELAPAQPEAKENYYRDIAVLAFPSPEDAGISTRTMKPVVNTSVAGADVQYLADPTSREIFRSDSWEAGSQNWTVRFPEEFRARRGYDLRPYLPAMAGIPVGSADVSERFVHDVRQTIAELIVENLAEVTVNGVACGVAWTAPLRVEITGTLRPGRNELRIDVTNTWANRLIGDHALPAGERVTWTTAPYRLGNRSLLPAGLLGPVTIVTDEPNG